jgi:phosphatidylglycerol:prolipoprotein diacylglycerol transferase
VPLSSVEFASTCDIALTPFRAILVIGFVLGAALSILRGWLWGTPPRTVLDASLAAACGAVLLGRALYTAANWDYFQTNTWEALQPWRGGLSSTGSLIGAVAGVVLLCHFRRVDARSMLDIMAPGGAIVVGSAWMGCLLAGCAWGVEVWPQQRFLWGLSAELGDQFGLSVPRVAVQLVGLGWSSLLLFVLLLLGRRWRPFPLWLLLHSAGDIGLGFLRGDLARLPIGLAPVQIASLVLALLGLTLLVAPGWPVLGSQSGSNAAGENT